MARWKEVYNHSPSLFLTGWRGWHLMLAPESQFGPPSFPPSFPDPTIPSPLISSGVPLCLSVSRISAPDHQALRLGWFNNPLSPHHHTSPPLHATSLYPQIIRGLGGNATSRKKKQNKTNPAPGVPSGLATRLDRELRRQSPAPIISASKAEKEDKGLTQKGLLVWKGMKWNEKCFSALPKS